MQYRFKEYELDTQKKILTKSGVDQNVTSQIYLLLEVLITHKNQILSKQDLIDKVWDGRIVSPRSIDSQIRSARAAIGDNGADQKLIKTFNNRGISFIAPVETVSEQQMTAPADYERTVTHRPKNLNFPVLITGLFMFSLAIAGIFYWNNQIRKNTNFPDSVATIEEKPSILFVPFEIFHDNDEAQILAKSIFLELKTSFEFSDELNLVSMSPLHSRNRDPEQLKDFIDEFNIHYVVSGFLIDEDNVHKLTLELTDARTGKILWTYSPDFFFDPEYDGVYRKRITQRSANLIFEALDIARPDMDPFYNDPNAYALYLEGRQLLERANLDAYQQAITAFERSLEIDKTLVSSHGMLAATYIQAISVYGFDPDIYGEKIEYHLRMGDNLDPTNSVLLHAKGAYAYQKSDKEKALDFFNRAIQFAPNQASSNYMRAATIYDMGRVVEAEQAYQDALKFNPTDATSLFNLALIKIDLGKFEEAHVLSERNYRWNPSDPAALNGVGISHFWQGNLGQARKYYLLGLKDYPDDSYLQLDLIMSQTFLGSVDDLENYMTYPSWRALFLAYQGDTEPAKQQISITQIPFEKVLLGYMAQDFGGVYEDAQKVARDNRYNDANREVGFTDIIYLIPLIEIYRVNQDPDTEILMGLLRQIFFEIDEDDFTPEAYAGAIALACFDEDVEEAIRLMLTAEQKNVPLLRVEKEPAYAALVRHPEYPPIRERMQTRAKSIIDNISFD